MTDIISIKVAGWIIGTSAVIAGALGYHDGVAIVPVETENVGGPSSGTINTLDQWVGSTSPTTAITQRVFGKGIRITGLSDGCLSLSSGLLASSGSACGAGGGASGGTWSTTTSQVAGTLVNYPNNATDVVNIGSNSTTTGEFWLDPNTNTARFTGSATTTLQFVPGGINPAYRLGLSWIESTPSISFLYDGSGTGDNNKLTIWDDSTSIERFTFLRGGKFGIATTSPYAALSVVGEAVARNFTATSTAATSTLPTLSVQTALDFFGTFANSLDDLCVAITGGAGLCDGNDASGAGGSGSVSTSTNEVANQVAVFTSNSATPATIGGDTDFTFSGNLLQITQASTTRGSCYGPCYFGATATSTFGADGVLTLITALAVGSGGTGANTLTDGGVLLGSGTGAITPMAVLGNGEIIVGDGTTDPVALAAFESSTGDLAVTAGGTGVGTLTGILEGNGTGDFTANDSSTAGQVLRVTGASTFGFGALDLDDTDAFTGTLPASAIEDSFLLNNGDIGTGVFDFGGATSFEIPNGGPTVDTTGEVGVDTTTGQFKWSYNGSSLGIRLPYEETGFGFASSTQGAATTTLRLGPAPHAITVTSAQCDFSNFMGISLYDGTNRADYFVASSTIGTITFSTNNTFTAGEAFRVDVGTSTNIGSAVSGGCTFKYTNTAD